MQIGKGSIRPTGHYILEHSDVSWDLIVKTILSPVKIHLGKDRFTYIKKFKKFVIEAHTKNDEMENEIWVINAFKIER